MEGRCWKYHLWWTGKSEIGTNVGGCCSGRMKIPWRRKSAAVTAPKLNVNPFPLCVVSHLQRERRARECCWTAGAGSELLFCLYSSSLLGGGYSLLDYEGFLHWTSFCLSLLDVLVGA
ncbi:hypothetical protein VIGAN_09076000 [Vigna angularis var. angularis]|uniref:Uncharacterized protein n=1 Tax=Vigna angularis var. angularis TaxID=157739 RepID=A0A0S3SWT8_PHAAN|nr:hypothetical protein VIGAN_09076000 [Vigna angularis var. angularis]